MKMTSLALVSMAGAFALVGQASAQSINIDIDATFGTPSISLAAAGVAGTWNNIAATANLAPLVDVTGVATGATISRTTGTGVGFSFNNILTSGDDQALMDDAQDPVAGGRWTIAGLTAGTYDVYTYGWAPDSNLYRTGISVNGGPLTPVGGAWTGVYTVGLTHAQDLVVLAAGTDITIDLTVVTTYATFNGVSLRLQGPPPPVAIPYCFGDGTGTACPCGNAGLTGNGCANSVNANGGNLAASGVPSITSDTLVLTGSGLTNASALYFQGEQRVNGGLGAVFGDGLRCAGTAVKRLGTKTGVGGTSSYPGPGDIPISIKGQNSAGAQRDYQAWYRNADVAFCPPATFNLTNAVELVWLP